MQCLSSGRFAPPRQVYWQGSWGLLLYFGAILLIPFDQAERFLVERQLVFRLDLCSLHVKELIDCQLFWTMSEVPATALLNFFLKLGRGMRNTLPSNTITPRHKLPYDFSAPYPRCTPPPPLPSTPVVFSYIKNTLCFSNALAISGNAIKLVVVVALTVTGTTSAQSNFLQFLSISWHNYRVFWKWNSHCYFCLRFGRLVIINSYLICIRRCVGFITICRRNTSFNLVHLK